MKVFGGSPSGSTSQPYRISGIHPVVGLDKIGVIVAVNGLESVGMTNNNDIAIGGVWFGHPYQSAECGANGVFGKGFNINARMIASAGLAESGNNLGSGKRKTVFVVTNGGKINNNMLADNNDDKKIIINDNELKIYNTLSKALKYNYKVKIHYYNLQHGKSTRTIYLL